MPYQRKALRLAVLVGPCHDRLIASHAIGDVVREFERRHEGLQPPIEDGPPELHFFGNGRSGEVARALLGIENAVSARDLEVEAALRSQAPTVTVHRRVHRRCRGGIAERDGALLRGEGARAFGDEQHLHSRGDRRKLLARGRRLEAPLGDAPKADE